MKMMAPIPGMSLTKEPGNSPWEQPPLYDKPEEALAFYLDKFNDEESLDDMLFAIESGYPVEPLVDLITSYGVMEGYHSIDVKQLISPILHEYVVSLLDASGIEYKEDFKGNKEERAAVRDKKRVQALLEKNLSGALAAPTDEGVAEAEDLLESPSEDNLTEEVSEEMPLIGRRV